MLQKASWLYQWVKNKFVRTARVLNKELLLSDPSLLTAFVQNNLELENYDIIYILLDKNTRKAINANQAKEKVSQAIIKSLSDPSFSSLLNQMIADSSQGNDASIDLSFTGSHITVEYNGMAMGAGHVIENELHKLGLEYNKVPGASRSSKNTKTTRTKNEQSQAEIMSRAAPNVYVQYANHVGYLLHNTTVLVDHPQLREVRDIDKNKLIRMQPDKWRSSYEAFIRLNGDFDADFLFRNVIDQSGQNLFAPFAEFAHRDGNMLRLTRYEFLSAFLDYLNLENSIPMRALPPGSPPERYNLKEFAQQALSSLIRFSPKTVDAETVKEWFELGSTGSLAS